MKHKKKHIIKKKKVMKKAFIPTLKTEKTFGISVENGKLKIEGRSIPQDAGAFFRPVFEKITDWAQEKTEVIIDAYIEYFNTASISWLFDLFSWFNEQNVKTTINWYYEEGDERMLLVGEHYKNLFTAYENITINVEETAIKL